MKRYRLVMFRPCYYGSSVELDPRVMESTLFFEGYRVQYIRWLLLVCHVALLEDSSFSVI